MSDTAWITVTASLAALAISFSGAWLFALARVVHLRRMIEGHCDRIAAQSELLARRAER